MRLLIISYGFMLQRAYQWKAVELDRRCEALMVVVPRAWKELWAGGSVALEEGPLQDLPHLQLPLWLNVDKHFALLPPTTLRRVLSNFCPDVIEFDNEPFNFGSAQVISAASRYAPGSKVFLHAAQNLLKRYPPPFNLVERYVFRRCAGVFARSPAAERVLQQRGLAAEKIYPMGHGVALREFSESRRLQRARLSKSGADAAGPLIYVGALTYQKGVDVLLKACASANSFDRIVLAGDGPRRAELEQMANDLGIRDRCRFLGRVPHQDLIELYGTASCIVMPSRTTPRLVEQFGRVLIEAMAAGCPLIASDSGNIPAVVGEAGVIVPEDDPDALSHAIDKVLVDLEYQRSLHERGIDRAEAEFEWSVVADRTMQAFRCSGTQP